MQEKEQCEATATLWVHGKLPFGPEYKILLRLYLFVPKVEIHEVY